MSNRVANLFYNIYIELILSAPSLLHVITQMSESASIDAWAVIVASEPYEFGTGDSRTVQCKLVEAKPDPEKKGFSLWLNCHGVFADTLRMLHAGHRLYLVNPQGNLVYPEKIHHLVVMDDANTQGMIVGGKHPTMFLSSPSPPTEYLAVRIIEQK